MCKTIGNHIVSKIVLMVVLCTGVAFQASSQGLRLEFPDNKATYQEIFREIEAQGSVRFAYKSQDFEGVGPVDVPQGGQLTLGEILDYIFKDTDYRYVLDGEHIFITKEKQEPVYDTPQTRLRRSVNPNASKPRAGTRELVSPGVDSTFKEVRHVSNTEPVCLNLDRMTGRNVPQNDHTHDLATIRSLHIVQNGSAAEIAFDIRIGPRAVNKKSTARLMPRIRMGDEVKNLPAIVVEGYRAKAWRLKGKTVQDVPERSVYTINGAVISFTATMPLDSLGVDCDLWLDVSVDKKRKLLVADNIMLAENFVVEGRITIPPVYRTIPPTQGDLLSQKYSFVAPLSELEEQSDTDTDDFVSESRGNSLTVYFRPGSTVIDPSYRDNSGALEYISDAISTLREAEEAGTSRISHIIVAGYSSPEGEPALNRYLAYKRAESLRDYLAKATGIDPGKIDIHNGGADWAGLRHQVERSELAGKDEVVALIGNGIDMTEEEEEALYAKLRSLGGGVYNRLLSEVFPELRVATYLRIYYENIGGE